MDNKASGKRSFDDESPKDETSDNQSQDEKKSKKQKRSEKVTKDLTESNDNINLDLEKLYRRIGRCISTLHKMLYEADNLGDSNKRMYDAGKTSIEYDKLIAKITEFHK